MGYSSFLWGNYPPVFWGLFGLLMIWSLVWKGLALWEAARRNQPWWFVIMLVVNTAGLLEIVYLVFVAKKWSSRNGKITKAE